MALGWMGFGLQRFVTLTDMGIGGKGRSVEKHRERHRDWEVFWLGFELLLSGDAP